MPVVMAILAILMMQEVARTTPSGDTPLPRRERLTQEDGFLNKGKVFQFPSADGVTPLSGIRFDHPESRGMVIVVNGRAESWLKYGELFRDLYRSGYSVASYDHRGQGLSPRSGAGDPAAGKIDRPRLYSGDLDAFVKAIGNPGPGGFLLLAHSMGATAALGAIEDHPATFRAVALSAPMAEINTSPWPTAMVPLLTGGLCMAGQGGRYAPGEHAHDPSEPFSGNRLTSDRVRWGAMQAVWNRHPFAVLGGPSNEWVYRIMSWTVQIRGRAATVRTPVLFLVAGKDQLVRNEASRRLVRRIPGALMLEFPESRHEILMECDSVRSPALREILRFFARTSPIGLDRQLGNGHSSGATSPHS